MPEARAKPSFAPRSFMRIMRWEIGLVMFGIGMGLYLPTLNRKRNEMRAESNGNATPSSQFQFPADKPRAHLPPNN